MTDTLLRGAYTLVFRLALPWLMWRLWWRGRRDPGYRQRLGERLGFIDAGSLAPGALWIHAVSVGETQAIAPLVTALLDAGPQSPLLLTSTTPTGAAHAQRLFGDRVGRCYLPFDTPGAVARFLDRTRPRALLLVETELWPNLLHACHVRGIPVLLVNARLSERSQRRYSLVRPLAAAMLRQLRAAAVQTEADGRRLVELGMAPDAVCVTGSLKFEMGMPADIDAQVAARRADCGGASPVWIAASTHAGEEAAVIDAHVALLRARSSALLLLAPRHPARAAELIALVERAGLSLRQRSRGQPCAPGTQVYLIDTLGELLPFYAVSDVAFVGGSLVDVGGHNLLEPAALGRPVLHGPFVINFAEISRLLQDAGAATMVRDGADLAAVLVRLMGSEATRQRMGQAGADVVRRHVGATGRVLALLRQTLGAAATPPLSVPAPKLP